MSRVTNSEAKTHHTTTQIPHEKIAMRAYEKWVKRGRPSGTADQDWMEAETELRAEMSRSSTTSTSATPNWQSAAGQRY
jgi:hypothetical protein